MVKTTMNNRIKNMVFKYLNTFEWNKTSFGSIDYLIINNEIQHKFVIYEDCLIISLKFFIKIKTLFSIEHNDIVKKILSSWIESHYNYNFVFTKINVSSLEYGQQ